MRLGSGFVAMWFCVVAGLALAGLVDNPVILPSWGLFAIAIPVPLCYLCGWIVELSLGRK